jgi:prolyl-tRNA synthetase
MKKENFSEWYTWAVDKANLSDKRYPIKGMNVWTTYGWKVMRLIDEHIRSEFDATEHGEVHFPLLIAENEFAKEAEHIKGFDEQVYWVTHAGDNLLDVKLLLRPTSETAIYPMFSLWIRSHADLPMKIYQIVNTFRYETKQTRSFIRVREIHFFEAHTCHAAFEDSERQIKEDLEIMERFAKKLCLPFLLCKRPEWDKFPGAFYTIGIDALMPTGKTLQLGSIHQYRDNFSKPYNIMYEDETGEHKYVHQTTFGMSERLLGAVIGIHGDDRGIILPPQIAPYQVVIVPILSKTVKEEILLEAETILNELLDANFRVHLDDRDIRPGSKYYDWESKGVPLRIEIGEQEMREGEITLSRRDTSEKKKVLKVDLIKEVADHLKKIEENLLKEAARKLEEGIINDLTGEKILRLGWCGKEDCAHEIENRTDKDILGPLAPKEDFKGKCVICGKETDIVVYAAKTY